MCGKDDLILMDELGPYGRLIDACMVSTIRNLRLEGWETVACCCGHGKYPESIVIKEGSLFFELLSGVEIERTRRYYVTDQEGYYFIPEIVKEGE